MTGASKASAHPVIDVIIESCNTTALSRRWLVRLSVLAITVTSDSPLIGDRIDPASRSLAKLDIYVFGIHDTWIALLPTAQIPGSFHL